MGKSGSKLTDVWKKVQIDVKKESFYSVMKIVVNYLGAKRGLV